MWGGSQVFRELLPSEHIGNQRPDQDTEPGRSVSHLVTLCVLVRTRGPNGERRYPNVGKKPLCVNCQKLWDELIFFSSDFG